MDDRAWARFESKFCPEAASGCWLWDGACIEGYYGMFWWRGRVRLAHRVSYEHFIGMPPDDIEVCHKCDVPACVNPDHLFLGTHHENMLDKCRKRRQDRKLSEEQVHAVRQALDMGSTGRQVARDFGISFQQVSRIKRRERWIHLQEAK